MIRISQLGVSTPEGRTLLSPIDLEVPGQAVLGLFGPNGSGKSSLLKAIAGEPAGVIRSGDVVMF
jgi:Fe-S cluster assembly ATPase SufC